MVRIAPVMPTEVPGNVDTAALFNATTKATGDWQVNVPRFKGWASTAQAIASGTAFVSLSLDSEYIDTEGGHSTTTNTSRYVCQVAGWYWVQGTCSVAASAAGNRSLQIAFNGATMPGSTVLQAAPSGNTWTAVTTTFLPLAVGDYVEVQVFQTSGGSLNTVATNSLQPTLSAVWISS